MHGKRDKRHRNGEHHLEYLALTGKDVELGLLGEEMKDHVAKRHRGEHEELREIARSGRHIRRELAEQPEEREEHPGEEEREAAQRENLYR